MFGMARAAGVSTLMFGHRLIQSASYGPPAPRDNRGMTQASGGKYLSDWTGRGSAQFTDRESSEIPLVPPCSQSLWYTLARLSRGTTRMAI